MQRLRRLVVIWAGMILAAVPLVGQRISSADWAAVTSLAAGTVVDIQRQDKGAVHGTIVSVSNIGVVLTLKKRTPTTLDRRDIALVYRAAKRRHTFGALVGAGIGAGTGAGLGYAICGGIGCTKRQGTGIGAAIFASAGALIGAAIGTHDDRILIYSNPNSSSSLIQ